MPNMSKMATIKIKSKTKNEAKILAAAMSTETGRHHTIGDALAFAIRCANDELSKGGTYCHSRPIPIS